MTSLEIQHSIAKKLIEDAQQSFPNETCGIMMGRREEAKPSLHYVDYIYPVNNVSTGDKSQHFVAAPDQIKTAFKLAKDKNMAVLGFYHSHPNGIAVPSKQDTDNTPPWPDYSHLIIACTPLTHHLRSWQRAGTGWQEQTIKGNLAMQTLVIPTPLMIYTEGKQQLQFSASSVEQLIQQAVAHYPALQSQLFDENQRLMRFINIFVNDDDVRMHDGLNTLLKDNDCIEIVPAIAGGNNLPQLKQTLQTSITQVVVSDVPTDLNMRQNTVVVDVRSKDEWVTGHIPGAIHIDKGFIEVIASKQLTNFDANIICYCESGVRSLFACRALQELGYTRVSNLVGGIQEWKAQSRKTETPITLNTKQRARYKRHVTLPEVGETGQVKLLNSKVLCIGAGGLGSPIALYLAAAGIGTLGIIDDDTVDISNLQRQILHTTQRVGEAKTDSAKLSLSALNPDITINTYQQRLTRDNAEELFKKYDIVIDGTDNFTSRYITNHFCKQLKIPFVFGSIFRFEGQVSTFLPNEGPCYECLYPEPPPPALAPSCADAGVLGVLPGVIGVLSAIEAIKIILSIGQPLSGKLLKYNALSSEFKKLNIVKDKYCKACQTL